MWFIVFCLVVLLICLWLKFNDKVNIGVVIIFLFLMIGFWVIWLIFKIVIFGWLIIGVNYCLLVELILLIVYVVFFIFFEVNLLLCVFIVSLLILLEILNIDLWLVCLIIGINNFLFVFVVILIF